MWNPSSGRVSPSRRVPPCTVAIPRDGSRNALSRRAVRLEDLARPPQAEGGLAVGDGAVNGPAAGLRKRHPVDLDDLGVLLRRLRRREATREEQVQPLGEDPRRAEAGAEALRVTGAHSRLLGQLAPR